MRLQILTDKPGLANYFLNNVYDIICAFKISKCDGKLVRN